MTRPNIPKKMRNGAPLRWMTECEGYVMCRHPNCAPFVLKTAEWDALELAPVKAKATVKKPLNGELTHPLTDIALRKLKALTKGNIPRQEFNPGVADRLLREDLVRQVRAKSPYASHKAGENVVFLEITDAGKQRLAAEGRHL